MDTIDDLLKEQGDAQAALAKMLHGVSEASRRLDRANGKLTDHIIGEYEEGTVGHLIGKLLAFDPAARIYGYQDEFDFYYPITDAGTETARRTPENKGKWFCGELESYGEFMEDDEFYTKGKPLEKVDILVIK